MQIHETHQLDIILVKDKIMERKTHLIFVNILIHFKYMDSQFIRPGHFAVKWMNTKTLIQRPPATHGIIPKYIRLLRINAIVRHNCKIPRYFKFFLQQQLLISFATSYFTDFFISHLIHRKNLNIYILLDTNSIKCQDWCQSGPSFFICFKFASVFK